MQLLDNHGILSFTKWPLNREHDPKTFHRSILHMIVLENGTSFCVGVVSYPDYLSHWTVGCFFEPCGKQHSISSASLSLPILGEYFNPPKCYSFEFNAGGKHFEVKIDLTQTSKLYCGENLVLQMSGCVEVNGSPGRCLAEYIYRCTDSQLPVVNAPEQYPLLSEPEISANDREMICIPFTKSACCSSSLVGGKGAQLGSLTTLSISNVKVPNGFCLSIKAYEIQLKENPVLKEEVEKLENIVLKNATGNVKDICEDVVSAFKQYAICSSVQKAIEQEMKVVFGDKQDETLLAVRSSAAGEDGTEMSAAGQMDTILGVKGFLQVFDAVVKCWASQYAYQAVEYRRQHGQPLRSVMGVVVQEMVLSEASGVLFTREPLTGDPAVMTINANYGLGEAIVSGEAEPDTITLSRTWDDKLAILDKKVGEKKVQMHVLEDGGTEIKEVGLKDMAKCCLTDAMILHLGNLGVLMEKYFGDPRDIEWAVHGGCLYLLQARPITSFDTESDYELIHEFDSPLASDKEWLTTANIQEMMPSAVTPLGLDNFGRSINYVFHNLYNEQRLLKLGNNLNLWKFMSVCRNHLFINIFHMGMTGENHVAGNNHVYAEVSLFGETLDNYPEEQILEYTGKGSFFNRLFAGFNGYLGRYVAKKMTKRWENVLKTYKIDGDSVQELYENITLYHPDMYQCWFDTVGNTSSSAIWSLLIVTVLSKGKTEWTAEISSDVAMILSKCEDVLSAGVPASIREIARSISEIGKDDEFLKLDSQTAVEWLNSEGSGKVKKQFADFLAQHGHRCVREAELRETSWRFEPTKLIPSIQAILKTKRFENELDRDVMSVADTIAKLKTPTTAKTRFILKWLIPWAREAVGKREWGKSISIEMMEAFKQAYWKLATLMVQESRLPDKDLLFFLTHDEIGKLIKTRSARLIARATRRRRIFPLQRDLQFPVLNTGHPIALDEGSESDDYFVTSVRLKGVPVSLGKIKGKARVVKSLKEAESIQYGEILIVSYTDVGWTPYFPLISGLVTEIGGLLSHGAVVAREYGLPCIVSCAKATYSFKSGDNVFLDATIGTIERIEEDVSRQQ
ncbi:rifampicin phosphotransferase-like isoform X2 [Tubulanus polymorphus]|uniref:rifampicin phosphotransferase-like isoform X2 n=1 Tax=Tubulanus polymorphus TaxID=672921 RepID=UPI003DA45734